MVAKGHLETLIPHRGEGESKGLYIHAPAGLTRAPFSVTCKSVLYSVMSDIRGMQALKAASE
jgi:hypothetical protein